MTTENMKTEELENEKSEINEVINQINFKEETSKDNQNLSENDSNQGNLYKEQESINIDLKKKMKIVVPSKIKKKTKYFK